MTAPLDFEIRVMCKHMESVGHSQAYKVLYPHSVQATVVTMQYLYLH